MPSNAFSSPYGAGKYESQRRGVENRYAIDSSQNAYGRFLSQQRGNRNLADTTRNFKQNYAPYASQFGARGLSTGGVQSGVRQRAMGNYVGDYYRNYGRQQQDLANEMQQFDMNQSLMDMWRAEELAAIDQQRTFDIASAAQNLEALREWLGGI